MNKYCPHCKQEHVVSSTYDNNEVLVGYFCNREKLLVEAVDSVWDGENIATDFINGWVYETVDTDALARIQPDRLIALSKRISYRIMRTDWANQRNINYAFVTYWVNEIVKRLYAEITVTEAI